MSRATKNLFPQKTKSREMMSRNLIIQYTAVAVILLGILIWIVIKSLKAKKKASVCGGCTLHKSCEKSKIIEKLKNNNVPDCRSDT